MKTLVSEQVRLEALTGLRLEGTMNDRIRIMREDVVQDLTDSLENAIVYLRGYLKGKRDGAKR